MENARFDLNDIENEPTDEQLEALMDSVAVEVRRRAELANAALMERIRQETEAAWQWYLGRQ